MPNAKLNASYIRWYPTTRKRGGPTCLDVLSASRAWCKGCRNAEKQKVDTGFRYSRWEKKECSFHSFICLTPLARLYPRLEYPCSHEELFTLSNLSGSWALVFTYNEAYNTIGWAGCDNRGNNLCHIIQSVKVQVKAGPYKPANKPCLRLPCCFSSHLLPLFYQWNNKERSNFLRLPPPILDPFVPL